jgi:pilus assembly protein CpaE
MPKQQDILVASRDPEMAAEIAQAIAAGDGFNVETQVLVNGHHDPLQQAKSMPAVVIIGLTETSKKELEAFSTYPADQRPALIVVGSDAHSCLMRLSMQAGARDFLNYPLNPKELNSAVKRITADLKSADDGAETRIVTFINAKGGSGSSFLAVNYAYICQTLGNKKTLLLDLDRQYAPLPQYLDMHAQASLFDALYVVSELDELAVEGFIARHSSGLGLMASNLNLMGEEMDANIDEGAALTGLLDILLQRHDRIVAEVPRHLDEVGAAMLAASDRILMVMQQSVPDLRNASRLYTIMTKDLGLDPERIHPLVNRYDNKASTDIEDIRKVLKSRQVHTICNDFSSASESIDMGVPLAELNAKAPAVEALHELNKTMEGVEEAQSQGLFARLMRR